MDAGDAHELVPSDTFERVEAVMQFVVGHVLLQEELDPEPTRDLAHWIALLAGHVGQAAAAIATARADDEYCGAAAAWLACAGADAIRARTAITGADRDTQLTDLQASLVTTQLLERRWAPAVRVAFVVDELGTLARLAMPLITTDAASKPVPGFRTLLFEALTETQPEGTPEVTQPRATTSR